MLMNKYRISTYPFRDRDLDDPTKIFLKLTEQSFHVVSFMYSITCTNYVETNFHCLLK
jgi:hypothetical protein